jgi:hypothetical protein
MDSFFMIRRFYFLHRSYFVWKELQTISFSCASLRNEFDELRSIELEMSFNLLPLSVDGLPLRSASNTEPVSRNF